MSAMYIPIGINRCCGKSQAFMWNDWLLQQPHILRLMLGWFMADRRLNNMLAALRAHIADLPAECFETSRRARCNKFGIVSIGDVVLIGSATPPILGEVILHAAVSAGASSEVVTLVSEFHVTTTLKRSWKCTRSGKNTVFCTTDIVCALVRSGDPIITVLQPLHATRNPDLRSSALLFNRVMLKPKT